ncbi:MAG: hypothetical protein IMX00_04405 [Limnochordales bacterium]|nr:hypothetical protein [Limnochordales bacterium]
MRLHNRLVKADLWLSTDLIRVVGDPVGLMLYQGMWHIADDSGCLPDDELQWKIMLFAGFDSIQPAMLREYADRLIAAGKLVRYEVDGRAYLWLRNFHVHQTLDYPSEPEYPLPEWIRWEPGSQRRDGRFVIDPSKCPVPVKRDTRRGFVIAEASLSQGNEEQVQSTDARSSKQGTDNGVSMTVQRQDSDTSVKCSSISLSGSCLGSGSKRESREEEGCGEREGLKSPDEQPPSKPVEPTDPKVTCLEYPPDFERFWAEYPRHIEKRRAFRAWQQVLRGRSRDAPRPSPEELIQAARNYALNCRVARRALEYIKHPATFLGRDEPWREWLNGPRLEELERVSGTRAWQQIRESPERAAQEAEAIAKHVITI